MLPYERTPVRARGIMAHVAAEVATLATCDAIPTVDASELSPEQFLQRYMRPNLPVMVTGLTDGWRATRDWVSVTSDGSRVVDMRAMSEAFGAAEVLVVDCDEALDTDLAREQMRFDRYADWWRARDDPSPRASPDAPPRDRPNAKLYVKDWSMASDFPDYRAYVTPPHFADDWLNAYWDERAQSAAASSARHPERDPESADPDPDPDPDGGGTHRFVYCGVEGTWTPLHADVLRSFSWSVNVVGRKRWLMVPPQRSVHLLARDGSGRRPRDLAAAVAADPLDPENQFPASRLSRPIVVDQPPGAAIFVPSLWYHQVHNLTDCVSVNHNWLNAANARLCWAMLRDELAEVREGLPDPEDRGDGVLCQRLVARRAGADYATFAGILASAIRRYARGEGTKNRSDASRSRKRRRNEERGGDEDEDETREGEGEEGEDVRSLGVAVGLLRQVLAADEDHDRDGNGDGGFDDAVVFVSGWEGREEALASARDALEAGEAILARRDAPSST